MAQINEKTGLIESISVDNEKLELKQELLWYAARGPRSIDNKTASQGSGHYFFRSNETKAFTMNKQKIISVSIYKGFAVVKFILINLVIYSDYFRKTCSRNPSAL